MNSAGTVTASIGKLFAQFRSGNKLAANELVALCYPELRRLAAAKMREERSDHSWQPTVLVNELYLELLKMKAFKADEDANADKKAFFGLAAFVMKRLLIHHARPLAARATKVEIDDYSNSDSYGPEDLQAIEDLLSKLGEIDPKLRTVVELKVFEGMGVDEIANQLKCSPRTIARHWSFAKQWLQDQLR